MFQKALPIWVENLEREMNILLGFHYLCKVEEELTLRIATAGKYRLFINGEFKYQGPARCAHGYYRMDELKIPAGQNRHIAVEVLNYYTNSFSDLRQPGFVQMELTDGERLVATGNDFSAFWLTHKVRKTPRFSYQRPMCEGYRLTADCNEWRMGDSCETAVPVKMVQQEKKNIIPRGIAYEALPVVQPAGVIVRGLAQLDFVPEHYIGGRQVDMIGDPEKLELAGWKPEELEWPLHLELQHFKTIGNTKINQPIAPGANLQTGAWELYSFDTIKTGYICTDFQCSEPCEVYITFEEKLADGDIASPHPEIVNTVKLQMDVGSHHFQSIEPYGFQYLKLLCTKGSLTVKGLSVMEVVCPYPITAEYMSTDPQLQTIFQAAVQTYRQNAPDIFMDCPNRERAGWLCDSFFMGLTEPKLTGQNSMEREFLRNFLLAENLDGLPEGMLPMCYPSDILHGSYIPNWSLWFILELANYYDRSCDEQLLSQAKKKIYGVLGWFSQYENQDGLLEKIQGWVFVEWSRSNDLTQDINFPTNMLYAKAMQTVGRLYRDSTLQRKAEILMQTIRDRSYNGEFFVDNEIYRDGNLASSGESTETCQYYAFFTGTATPETHPKLWKKLMTEFGPERERTNAYPQIAPSNMFIGYYLRLELLRLTGQKEKIKQECKGYFYSMATITGTLWENKTDYASCNHGFASYAAALLLDAENEG